MMASGLIPEFALLLTNLYAPAGTRMTFHNAAAPLGWAIDTNITDHTIQVNGAAGGTSGGVNGYSAMFSAQWASDGHNLTVPELATHNHGVVDPSHTHTGASGANFYTGGTGAFTVATQGGTNSTLEGSSAATTGITVTNAGSGVAHSHTKTFNAKYVAMVMAGKL